MDSLDIKAFVAGIKPVHVAILLAAIIVARIVYGVVVDLVTAASVPSITVPVTEAEAADVLDAPEYANGDVSQKDNIPCYDPATMQFLGNAPAFSPQQVVDSVKNAKVAAKAWKSSTFGQRRKLLRIFLKYIIDHQEIICKVSARDTGKVMLDAVLSEIVVTCEKMQWLIDHGEKHLKPERRGAGVMAFYKSVRVEYHPVGVVGAIVPWNHPFHNIMNPMSAAIFAGNAIVIKVSEHSSWCASFYQRLISAALAAAGAPPHLVQIVTGYGDAGAALVTSGVDHLIFVGSTVVGRKVMEAASSTLTPVTLELGGKDAFVVCEDADLKTVIPIALKAAFFTCGQNCAGGERFIVHRKILDTYLSQVASITQQIRVGVPLGGDTVDSGAMCMKGSPEKVQMLIDDAVKRGARVLAGGKLMEGKGQFYPPTVITDVTPDMLIWTEEVFGPVMTVVPFSTDDEAVAIANDCAFGLGSNVFSGSQARARAIASRVEAGMASVNDFAATYMAQSLPFGGVKESGFGRFAGIEGLRALCVPKAVAEDAVPWLMSTALPPPWHYPVQDCGYDFARALVTMFYGPSLLVKARGLFWVAGIFLLPAAKKGKKKV